MKKPSDRSKLKVLAIRGRVLGVNVYRGFGRLCDIAAISKADIYDQKTNPQGTQRDLSPSHARAAYEYVKNQDLGFWPEVFLCARKKDAVTFKPISDDTPDVGWLEIDLDRIKKSGAILISRVDGNHRLHYGEGTEEGYSEIDKTVSFCLAYDLTRNEEIQLFKDINDNQKAMNTSHLDGIKVRLTPEETLKRRHPDLYIAQRLGRDKKSPFSGRVYEGGKKQVGAHVPLHGLKTGIEYMLSRSTQLPHLDDAEAQYRVIRNYFEAFKKWQPKAWSTPKEYIVLSGSGLWAICFIGSQIIDRSLLKGKFDDEFMLKLLRSGREWDWSRKGDFKGLGGRAGAVEISSRVIRKLRDDASVTTKQLFDRIMSD